MNVTFIGSGNCAMVLARLCRQKGQHVKQIISRNEISGSALAEETGASYINMTGIPDMNTDLVIIALSDNALYKALAGFNFGNIPVVHTGGSASVQVLENVSKNIGVFYPLQSLSRDNMKIPSIPFIIEAGNPEMLVFLKGFALTLGDHAEEMSEEKRLRLHAAAVIVNNFTNYLYGVAKTFCDSEQLDFNLLKPLILETAERIMHHSPLDVQTGPAVRKDNVTLDKHLRLLNDYPKLRTMYMRLTDGIMHP